MKYLVLASVLLLSGCVRSLLLVKAVQVHTGSNAFVKCVVTADQQVKQETKAKADQLCKDIQVQFNSPGAPIH